MWTDRPGRLVSEPQGVSLDTHTGPPETRALTGGTLWRNTKQEAHGPGLLRRGAQALLELCTQPLSRVPLSELDCCSWTTKRAEC